MAWYDPRSWFSSAPADATVETPTASSEPAPLGGPYGGKKRKTRKAKKTGAKRGRTGKKSSRS